MLMTGPSVAGVLVPCIARVTKGGSQSADGGREMNVEQSQFQALTGCHRQSEALTEANMLTNPLGMPHYMLAMKVRIGHNPGDDETFSYIAICSRHHRLCSRQVSSVSVQVTIHMYHGSMCVGLHLRTLRQLAE
jgi:hypothetical protein